MWLSLHAVMRSVTCANTTDLRLFRKALFLRIFVYSDVVKLINAFVVCLNASTRLTRLHCFVTLDA